MDRRKFLAGALTGLGLLGRGCRASGSPTLGPLLPLEALAIFDEFPFRVRATVVPLTVGEQTIQWQCAVIELYHRGDWHGVHWTAINPSPGPHFKPWWNYRSKEGWINYFRRNLD